MDCVDIFAGECLQDGNIGQIAGVNDNVAAVKGVGNSVEKIVVTGNQMGI